MTILSPGERSSPASLQLPPRANALSGERVGLDQVDDGVWHIYFGAVLIATREPHAV